APVRTAIPAFTAHSRLPRDQRRPPSSGTSSMAAASRQVATRFVLQRGRHYGYTVGPTRLAFARSPWPTASARAAGRSQRAMLYSFRATAQRTPEYSRTLALTPRDGHEPLADRDGHLPVQRRRG